MIKAWLFFNYSAKVWYTSPQIIWHIVSELILMMSSCTNMHISLLSFIYLHFNMTITNKTPGLWTWIRKLLLHSFMRHLTWWCTFMCCKIPNISIGTRCANCKALPHCHPDHHVNIYFIKWLLNEKYALCENKYTPQNMLCWVES